MNNGFGISGMGRIGRLVVRRMFSAAPGSPGNPLLLKVINCLYPAADLAHLLRYDSVHGRWDAQISVDNGDLVINGSRIKVVCERQPERIPWESLGVAVVMDATGKFNNREGAERHLQAGTDTVIVTAPGTNMDLTVVMGVNEHRYNPLKHRILSAASCTTNCLAPVLDILDQAFQVKWGWMTTVHAFTNDQNHLDNPHKDLRRARACTQSIIPTTTGVGKALTDVLPHLAASIEGISLRVPTQDVSLLDLTVQLGRPKIDVAEVKSVFRSAAEGAYSRYVGYTEEPLVSADFIGCSKSAVVDGLSLNAVRGQLKVLAWYDNEWAYACRVVDLANFAQERMAEAWRTKTAIH